jgi:hypothetical protein
MVDLAGEKFLTGQIFHEFSPIKNELQIVEKEKPTEIQ